MMSTSGGFSWILIISYTEHIYFSNSVILYSFSCINYVVCFAVENGHSLSFSRNSLTVIIFIVSPNCIFCKSSRFRGRKHNKPILCVRWIKIQISHLAWLPDPTSGSTSTPQTQHKRIQKKILLPVFYHSIQLWKWKLISGSLIIWQILNIVH